MSRHEEGRTERLILRRWRAEDRAPFAVMNADPRVTRYLGHPPLTVAESDALVDRIEHRWAERGLGQWAVELRGKDPFIGFLGFASHHWHPDVLELGWRLRPDLWGRGLATEGARAALSHGFGQLGLERVISIIHRDNVASRRVAERCGFRVWREETRQSASDGTLLPIVVYEVEST